MPSSKSVSNKFLRLSSVGLFLPNHSRKYNLSRSHKIELKDHRPYSLPHFAVEWRYVGIVACITMVSKSRGDPNDNSEGDVSPEFRVSGLKLFKCVVEAQSIYGISSWTEVIYLYEALWALFKIIPPQYHNAALVAYNDSLRTCFQVALILACLCILDGLGMEWRSVKKEQENPPPQTPGGEQAIEEGDNRRDSSDAEMKP
ncbi:hypothetical protein MMC08_009039 [Hypocenomyce scalaris]|nr:hypothetical protein [Hypocenomyce scalaris]